MIEFKEVRKSYKTKQVLKGINLTIADGEFMVLIGSSGCGKTTLLKTINKLISIDSGDVIINGVNVRELDETQLPKKIGYVVQGRVVPSYDHRGQHSFDHEACGMAGR